MKNVVTMDFWMDQVFKYYPRYISPFSIEYDLSSQTIRKKKYLAARRAEIAASWGFTIQLLTQKFIIEDVTPVFESNLSNYFTFKTNSSSYFKGHAIFSLLLPVHLYVFTLASGESLSVVNRGDLSITDHVKDDISADCESINQVMFSVLHSEEVAAKDFQHVMVDSISTQDTGEGRATLFDLIFSADFIMF